jgi:hypothetical protein
MNDHQREQSRGQNSAYRHRTYEGRFRKRRRPSIFYLGKTSSRARRKTLRNLTDFIFRFDYDSES